MEDLRALAESGDGNDRAFVDANLRMAWARASGDAERARLEELHLLVRESARRAHAPMRGQIASGELRGRALRERFEARPPLERDHFVEEVLGVAYPPLEERPLGRELVTYTPSGYAEIVHALDVTAIGPGDRFLDIGAGTGKVVLLAALLAGATGAGIECDITLVERARAAAADTGALGVRFEHADARDVALPDADVVFMYVPFTGDTLAAVMERVRRGRARFVCCAPLDRERHSELVPIGPPCSWLQVHRSSVTLDP